MFAENIFDITKSDGTHVTELKEGNNILWERAVQCVTDKQPVISFRNTRRTNGDGINYPVFSAEQVLPHLKAFGAHSKRKADKLWGRYIPCEYISFDGSSYLDLAPLKTESDIEITFRRRDGYTQTNFLFGTNPNSNTSPVVGAWYGSQGLTTQNGSVRNSGSLNTDWHTLKVTSTKTYLDGAELTSAGTRTTFQNLIIGSARDERTAAVDSRCFHGDISRVKVGNKIFIPVKDVVTNAFGLFDVSGEKFYGNSGTGSISGGTVIQPVSYAQSTGTQYIDCDFIPNSNSKVVLDAQYTQVENVILFGSRTANASSGDKFTVNISSNSFANGWGSNSTFTGGTANAERHKFTLSSDGGYVDGTKIANVSGEFNGTKSAYLFAVHQGDAASLFAKAKVYSLKLWDNGTLVRDYLPARVGQNVELLDLVEWKFATRTGTLTAGADIPYSQLCPDIIEVNTGNILYGQYGSNLFDGASNIVYGKYIDAATGEVTDHAANFYCETFFEVKPNTSYSFWGERKSDGYISRYNRIHFYDANKTFISSSTYNVGQKSVAVSPTGAKYARVSCNVLSDVSNPCNAAQVALFNWYFGEGTATTPYEPYHFGLHTDGQHKLIVGEQGVVDLGTLSWIRQTDGTYPVFRATINAPSVTSGAPPIFTTAYTVHSSVITATFIKTNLLDKTVAYQASSATNQLMVQDSRFADVTSLKAYMSGKYLFYRCTDDASFIPPIIRTIPTLYSEDSFCDTQLDTNNVSEAWGCKVLTGASDGIWSMHASLHGLFFLNLTAEGALVQPTADNYGECTCAEAVRKTAGSISMGECCFQALNATSNARFALRLPFDSVDELKAYLAEHNAIIMFPLATPAILSAAVESVALTTKANRTVTAEAELAVKSQATYLGKG